MNDKLNVKIAFFDIDGTLTTSKKELTKDTIKTLNKAQKNGIELVLCSGRSNSYILNYTKKFNNINYIISSNGCRILDTKTNTNIYINKFKLENIIKLYNYANENKLSFTLTGNEITYVNNYTKLDNHDYQNLNIVVLNNENEISNLVYYQIIIKSNELGKMIKLEEYINSLKDIKVINYTLDYLEKRENGYYFFDIVNTSVSKGTAIKYLLEYKKIKKENSICFGDSVNDRDMFNECGIRVAMGNALDNIKEKADYITETNDNEGISNFFNKYIY